GPVRPRAAGYPRLTPPVVLPDPASGDDAGQVPGPVAPGPVARLLRRVDPLAALLVVVVVVGGLVLSIGTVRALSGDTPPPLPSASTGATASASLLVGVGSPDGLVVGAVLGRDGATAVSLLLPGNALVDDGSGLGPISRPAPVSTSTATSGATTAPTTATASRTASGAARPTAPATPVPGAASPPSAATVADTAARVGDALGVRLDGAWVLSPVGLAGLVDAAGGVQVDVDDSAGAAGAGLPPGPARLNGAQAVAYATTLAANEQAEARLSRFQQVLAGVVLALPAAEDRLAAVVTGLAAESAGTVPATTVADLLLSVRDAAAGVPLAGTIVPLRIVTSPDGDSLGRALDGPATQGLVARLLPGAVSEAAEDVAVRVVDGVGRDGLTSAAVSRLRAASLGADVTTAQATTAPSASPGPGAAPDDPVTRSTVTVAGSDDAARLLGARVAAALHLPADAVLLGEPTAGADVLVVLGPDFAQDVAQHGV
ncbi:LCP family protein, partial [Kineosporia sp. R_H_3]|uniref:LCP family glycopolymer transferase n=1 Tax=Kineosporia sp. R_H_3 TaxID=1961848 RepID=UPI00117B3304